ncbi:MAG: hypothetical protein ACJ72N_09520 [Labedaea sp.]
METLIGFAIGYLVGSRQGRDGLAKVRESWDAIRQSPEVHQLIRTGALVAGSAVRQVLGGGGGAMVSDVLDTLARKSGLREETAA